MINTSNIILNDNFETKTNNLLERIIKLKTDTSTRLFMVTEAYDRYNKEYYRISLTILILSSIITFIEALRLTIIEYISKDNNNNKLMIYNITFTLNISLLVIGTIITILSSIIRFKNYKEILEGLKEAQTLLVNYKNKYSKQYYILDNIKSNDKIYEISNKISDYDKKVKSINYFQYIENKNIIEYNEKKIKFDLDIFKIKATLQNELERFSKIKESEFININNNHNLKLEELKNEKYKNINDIYFDKEEFKIDLLKKKKKLNDEANDITVDLKRLSSTDQSAI
uniref:SMODS and SLOG-associating 2TM effector domain-containing protein n=1 Tax=viral metagenome TaxID=1070528 RepID=A0A6C0JNJ6_9ZZZZ